MNIKFVVMVSPIEERRQNVELLKQQIPDLICVEADRSKCDLFTVYLSLLDCEGYDGLVMIEDDVKLCNGFLEKIAEKISEHSTDVIQFFTRW